MARTALTVTTVTAESSTAFVIASTGVAIDATNHHVITPPAGCTPEELVLLVTNTTASTKAATVKAGDNPPAVRATAGDLAVSLTAGDSTPTHKLVPLSSSRFLQDDGTVLVDIESGMTGRIAVLRIPRGA